MFGVLSRLVATRCSPLCAQAADDQHAEADFARVRHPRRRRAQQRRARAYIRRRAQRRAAGCGARARQEGSGALGLSALQARASVRHTNIALPLVIR